MISRHHNLSLGIVFFLLGVLLVASFFNQERARSTAPRQTELIEVVTKLTRDRDQLREEATALRDEVSGYEKRAAAAKGKLAQYTREEKDLRRAAGLTRLRGDGLEVILADGVAVPADENPDDYLVHDYDLVAIVNALRASGAEGTAVNGRRLISTSSIRSAGSTIIVNSELLAPPYTVSAIGNNQELRKGLAGDPVASAMIGQSAEGAKIRITIAQPESVTLPAYQGTLNFKFARTADLAKSAVRAGQ